MSDAGPAVKLTRLDPRLVRQVVAFGIVVVAALYIGTMAFAVDVLSTGVTIGRVLAFSVGTAVSYLGNARFAFRAPMSRSNFRRFVALVGIPLSAGVADAREAQGWHHPAIGLTMLPMVPVLNLEGHRLWTFR